MPRQLDQWTRIWTRWTTPFTQPTAYTSPFGRSSAAREPLVGPGRPARERHGLARGGELRRRGLVGAQRGAEGARDGALRARRARRGAGRAQPVAQPRARAAAPRGAPGPRAGGAAPAPARRGPRRARRRAGWRPSAGRGSASAPVAARRPGTSEDFVAEDGDRGGLPVTVLRVCSPRRRWSKSAPGVNASSLQALRVAALEPCVSRMSACQRVPLRLRPLVSNRRPATTMNMWLDFV